MCLGSQQVCDPDGHVGLCTLYEMERRPVSLTGLPKENNLCIPSNKLLDIYMCQAQCGYNNERPGPAFEELSANK